MTKKLLAIATVLFCASGAYSAGDILIADFEGDTYGDWTVTGEAFGPGPDKGTVEEKFKVVGFRGEGFANSCWKGFRGRGTLTSPKFKIQRRYIGFLVCGGSGIIGSGSNDGKTFVNLLVDGKVVRSLHPTGIGRSTPDRKKGVETMLPMRWDVSDLTGKEAVVQIIDHQSNHLARIDVDHIYQSDTEPQSVAHFTREMTIDKKYLIIPIRNTAKMCDLQLEVSGKKVRQFHAEIAEDADSVDFYAYLTIEPYKLNMPGMPFNQAFTMPHRLSLRTTEDGVRLFAKPIEEIAKLRKKSHTPISGELTPDKPKSVAVSGRLFEIFAEFNVGDAKKVGLDIGGNRVFYDVAGNKLSGADLKPVDGKISMQVIVDRPMMEICGNDGRVYITSGRGPYRPADWHHEIKDAHLLGDVSAIEAFAEGGKAELIKLEVHELKSIWKKQG